MHHSPIPLALALLSVSGTARAQTTGGASSSGKGDVPVLIEAGGDVVTLGDAECKRGSCTARMPAGRSLVGVIALALSGGETRASVAPWSSAQPKTAAPRLALEPLFIPRVAGEHQVPAWGAGVSVVF